MSLYYMKYHYNTDIKFVILLKNCYNFVRFTQLYRIPFK